MSLKTVAIDQERCSNGVRQNKVVAPVEMSCVYGRRTFIFSVSPERRRRREVTVSRERRFLGLRKSDGARRESLRSREI